MLVDGIHKFAHLTGDGMQHGVIRYKLKRCDPASDFCCKKLITSLVNIKPSSKLLDLSFRFSEASFTVEALNLY